MKIAVAGGTGWVGRYVVEKLRAAGDEPVVLARSAGIDLISGRGLDAALAGVSAVIDVSNLTTVSKKKSIAFFETATRNLLMAGQRAGITHHVMLSVVGSNRVDLGYYMGKRRQEELVLSSPVPHSILRATQFYEFAAQILRRQRGPFVLVPKMISQPIAAREAAGALVKLVSDSPIGMGPDLAGPDQHAMPDVVRQLTRTLGCRRVVITVRLPGPAGRAMADGGLLATGPGPRGRQTLDQWLATDALAAPARPTG